MKCANEECYPEIGCHIGHPDLAECHHFKGAESEATTDEGDIVDTVRMPWTGRTMGERDIAFVAAEYGATIVSLIGPHDSGKTTLLAALFLAIRNGLCPTNGIRFAGSFSLSGWHDISSLMQLDATAKFEFPPHTPDSPGRIPGLLHLRYASDNYSKNLLFADAPGEWFARWSREPSADASKGARWIADKARRHLVIADSRSLSGENQYKAREDFQRIVSRVSDVSISGNVALVWTKADLSVSDEMREQIDSIFAAKFANSPRFSTQIPLEYKEIVKSDPRSLKDILDWVLSDPEMRSLSGPSRAATSDPLFSFGR